MLFTNTWKLGQLILGITTKYRNEKNDPILILVNYNFIAFIGKYQAFLVFNLSRSTFPAFCCATQQIELECCGTRAGKRAFFVC